MAPPPRARSQPPSTVLESGGQRALAKSKQHQQAAKKAQQQDHMWNPINLKNNMQMVYFLRIYVTIVAGAAVGIMGITGLPGFYAYLISQALATIPVLLKTGGNVHKFFPSWTQVLMDHVFSSTAILSYILAWMVFYNIAHVFT